MIHVGTARFITYVYSIRSVDIVGNVIASDETPKETSGGSEMMIGTKRQRECR